MGFCESLAKGFIYAFTGILMVMGVAILGSSLYVNSNYSDFSDLFSSWGLMMGAICGAALFLVSFLGCWGTKTQNKCFIFVFLVVVFVVLLAQFAAGVAYLGYIGKLDDVTANSTKAEDLVDATNKKINDFIYSTYNTCCYADPDICQTLPTVTGPPYFCRKVTKCGLLSPPACLVGDEISVKKEVCTALSEGGFTCEKALTGLDLFLAPKKYQRNVYNFMDKNTKFFGRIAAFIGGIEVLALVFSIVLMCQNKDQFYEDDRV